MSDHTYETPEILSDEPLRSADEAHFHFDEFAITLARLAASKETRTPLTIGLSGAWGSGKTTLLRRIRVLLDQTQVLLTPGEPAILDFVNPLENPAEVYRACKTVWFNAWKYADEEQLLVALVRVIVQAMFSDDFISKGAATILEPFTPRRNVIDTVLYWFSIKVAGAEVGLNTGEAVETPFAEKTALLDLFDEAFDRLMAAWVHRRLDVDKINPQHGVLVVFIDDLDRCLPAKAVQVLEAVKLFLDKPGCIFILGADTRVVRDAVRKYYSDAGVTGERAGDYLEKIIQLRFDLPPIPADRMGDYLSGVPEADETLRAYWQVLVAGAEVNPRKVKTYLNDLNLAWAMLLNSGQAEGVDRADFIRWQVLMRTAPENFRRRVLEIEDRDLAFKFIQDALRWAKGEGDETLENTFREYAASRRLRRTLRAIKSFGEQFDPEALNAFLHLTAPPPSRAEVLDQPVQTIQDRETDGLEIPVSTEEKRAIHPRSGEQSFGGLAFMPVTAGKFLMGSREEDELAYDGEYPQHTVEIPYTYYIGRFPVTNQDYYAYTKVARKDFSIPEGKADHPVVRVSWNDSQNYCQWLNQTYPGELPEGYTFRLATEAEWEKAARGEYGNLWPWGNEWNPKRCNSTEEGPRSTNPVGAYSPAGDSPYGAADLAGNVWEWTNSLYMPYPYAADDGREDPNITKSRVVRGGGFGSDRGHVRAAYRNDFYPDFLRRLLGLRVVVAPQLS